MRFLFFLIIAVVAFATSYVRASDCEMCQFAFSVTEDLLYQNASVNEILPALTNACNYHGEEFAEYCNDVVDTLGFALMSEATEQASALDACTNLGVCEVENTDLLFKKHHWHIKWNPLKKLKCKACKSVVKSAEKVVNKGTDEGKSIAHGECKHLGKPLSHICEKLVNKIFHKVINELKRHENPGKICKKLHMCK